MEDAHADITRFVPCEQQPSLTVNRQALHLYISHIYDWRKWSEQKLNLLAKGDRRKKINHRRDANTHAACNKAAYLSVSDY